MAIGQAGIDEEDLARLIRKIKEYAQIAGSIEVADGVVEIGEKIVEDMKTRIPTGPTGNLRRRGIKAGAFKRALFQKRGGDKAHAFVARHYRWGPHAHFLEYGTAKRFKKNGQPTGSMPRMPFFHPVIRAWSGSRFLNEMAKVMRQAIETKGKRIR